MLALQFIAVFHLHITNARQVTERCCLGAAITQQLWMDIRAQLGEIFEIYNTNKRLQHAYRIIE